MELHRYDVVKAELKIRDANGSIQKKVRPYVVVSNSKGLNYSPNVTIMPLTHVIKKKHLPVHGCIAADSDNGLSVYSMVLGEMPQTVSKEDEIIDVIGNVSDKSQRNLIDKVCYNTFFFGEDINWEEVLA